MSDSASGVPNLYGIVGQPLTQNYLATQLPIFQPKVPNSQPTLQFPTNAPANLPLPSLYPGEVIQLQEHMVVCTETFEEPAVGAVYISNYRIIFLGNLISDPESMDTLRDTNVVKTLPRKDEAVTSSPFPLSSSSSSSTSKQGGKFKPFSSSKGEPTFKSFLTGGSGSSGNQEAISESTPASSFVPKSNAQRLKSGIKKSLGSLRLSPRNRPKLNARSLPEVTDGPSKPEISLLKVSKSKDENIPGSGSQQKAKRKDIMQNYHQDTVSLDSVSVSSTSEFSTAGTDERSTCSPLGDGESSTSGPMDILGGVERVCVNGGERSLGFSDVVSFNGLEESPLEVSESSFRTVDSGINVDRTTSLSFGNGGGIGKGSSPNRSVGKWSSHSPKHTTGTGSPSLKTQVNRKEQVNGQTDGQTENPEQEREEEELCRLLGSRSGTLREEGEGADPLGGSGTQSGHSTLKSDGTQSRSNTLKEDLSKDINVEELLQSCGKLSFAGRETASCAEPTSNGACSTAGPDHASSDAAVAQAPDSEKTEVGGGENETQRRGYANIFVARPEDRPGGGAELRRSSLSRKRSKSNSPYMRKKPKPLPRKSLTNKQILTESMKNELLSSLPANFKPVPLPRPPSLTNGMSKSPSKRRPLKSGPPHPTIPAKQGISASSSPRKGKVSNSGSPLRMDGVVSSTSTPRYRSPSGAPLGVGDTPRHTDNKRPPFSAPCTPRRAGGLTVGGGGTDTPTSPHSASTPSTPLLESSNPSSPLHDSSTSNLSSDVDSGGGVTATTGSDPVPPPRRKRKSSRYKSQSSKDSLFPVNVLPVSPEEPSPDHERQLGEQVDGGVAKEKQSLSSTSSKSHDPDGSESSRSRDLSEEDLLNSPILLEESGDIFRDDPQFTPPSNSSKFPGVDRNSKFSIGSSNRTSRTSLTVFADSSQSGVSTTLRPYSVVAHDDISMSDSYERISESYSTSGHNTLPRIGTLNTWTPRQQRQSVKVLMPASTRYSLSVSFPLRAVHTVRKLSSVSLKEYSLKLPEGLLVLCKNCQSMKLHIHPHNTYDADNLKELLERKFLVDKPIYELFAFQYRAAIRHPNPTFLHNRNLPNYFSISSEMSRLGLQESRLWTVTRVLLNHPELCPSYPSHVIVPTCTGDLDYIRGAKQYLEGRFPTLTWYDQRSGAALFRAGSTVDGRGQVTSSMQADEALLRSISGSKLDPGGPATKVHVYTDKAESGHNDRSAEQVRTYNYHNCKFVYSSNSPTYRHVRHSFSKLQAMLENALPDEDYLLALDTTKWLPRVGELLSTAQSICDTLMKEGAHALVCYEAGWDRTTQLVSLAQLLMDPYYRTMDGFQVLVQKEWVWFGHPFQLRHSHSRFGKSKDDGPVFLQWVDCVWQVLQQSPSAFEFNERFLMTMVEHSYSGMFGTFMTNSETARKQPFSEKSHEHMSVSTHTISFWTWVNMVNAAGRAFYNPLYDPNTYRSTIEPRSALPCLRLWTSHYCRYKPQENVYQTSVLQSQLEELVQKYKKLEAAYEALEPAKEMTPPPSFPPPVGPRDELFGGSSGRYGSGDRPVPPPKPVSKTYKYENVKEFLEKEGFDPSIGGHLELGSATCQGLLFKLGAVRKNWLQRFFILDFNCQYLAYFENKEAYINKQSPKGVIKLSDITRVFQDVKRKDHLQKNIFMVETPHRTYQMQAPTILAMEMWKACLELPSSALKLGSS